MAPASVAGSDAYGMFPSRNQARNFGAHSMLEILTCAHGAKLDKKRANNGEIALRPRMPEGVPWSDHVYHIFQ
jgi:hypothetical protein